MLKKIDINLEFDESKFNDSKIIELLRNQQQKMKEKSKNKLFK